MKARPITIFSFLAPNLIGFMIFTLIPIGAALLLSFYAWDLFSPPRFVGADNYLFIIGFRLRENVEPLRGGLLIVMGVLFLVTVWSRKVSGLNHTVRWLLAMAGMACVAAGALQWYEPVNPRFWYYVYNTLFLMIGLPFSMIGSLVLASLLNQKYFGQNFFRLAFFLPSIVSSVGIYLLWKWIFQPDYGLINAALAQIGVFGPRWLESTTWVKPALVMMDFWGRVGGMNMLLYLAALQNINPELYEAADIDGANAWHRFWKITWPMVSPTTFFILVMGIIQGFQSGFDAAYVMTRGGPAGASTTLSYFIYENAFNFFYMGRAAAASWILFAIVLGCTWLNWKLSANRIHY
ncbi:sugar ABC transporter permease [Ruficoccus amylovorans]|uniref:Sugar ABC transporter permease n=1 Tax=Ruficoccus amylovorans TaxID=1804625 RepID=A0A842HCQ5_9BACT|nr:sugar ABC transporter permease [Ruficoccus amylovorans]MBC2593476.1 sugar ABC transporter permease [Ruficoccus amylovorans]